MNDAEFERKYGHSDYKIMFEPEKYKTFKDLEEYCPFIYSISELGNVEVYMELPDKNNVYHVKPNFRDQWLNPSIAIRCIGVQQGDMWLILRGYKWYRTVRNAKNKSGRKPYIVSKKNKWIHCIIGSTGREQKYILRVLESWTEDTKQEFYDRIKEIVDNQFY